MVDIKQKLKEIITNYKDNKPFDVVINQMLSLYFKIEEESKGIENLDNPITVELLKEYGFEYYGKYSSCYEITIKKEFRTFTFGICLKPLKEDNNSFYLQVDGGTLSHFHYGLLETEKHLINLLLSILNFKLTKKL